MIQDSRCKEPRLLASNEDETATTIPLTARPGTARIQPKAITTAASTEKVRIAIRIFDGFMKHHEPVKTHSLQFPVREVFPDQAGDFSVRLAELSLFGVRTNVGGDAVFVCKEFSLQYSNLKSDAISGHEV